MKQRTLRCIDCGGAFVHEYVTGAPPERCGPCREAHRKQHNANRQKAWREANRDRAREHWNKHNRKRLADPEYVKRKNDERILRMYGITRDGYDQMLEAQGGVCAICKGPRNGPGKFFHIDHCHNSSRVRGLLCGKCNTAVGLLDDDPARAEALAQYLRE